MNFGKHGPSILGFLLGMMRMVLGIPFSQPYPLVIYHGMGDTATSEGMIALKEQLETLVPGLFIHIIQIGKNSEEDRTFSIFDNVDRQISEVCEQLGSIPELSMGFNAIGFSQGGQFMRAYVERCNTPPVRNLITIGSQHQGVMDLPGCQPASSRLGASGELKDLNIASWPIFSEGSEPPNSDCGMWKRLLKMGVYSRFAQEHIVQAQFFKDPHRLNTFMNENRFLTDINNELETKNKEYRENMLKLNKFIMYMFEDDDWVVPQLSSVFGFFNGAELLTLREQAIYQEDWIGLRSLDLRGDLHFGLIPGKHMVIRNEFVQDELLKWLVD